MTSPTLVAVVVAGAAGAAARYLIIVRMSSSPAATLLVNIIGSFALGALAVAGGAATLAVAGAGFLGAFTTFSTFALQTLQLHHDRRRRSLQYAAAMVAGCALAAAAGFAAADVPWA